MKEVMNPRSVLHALEPLGLGTGEVESLLSYFCRLAVSHSTSTLCLSRAVAQRFEHDVDEQFDWFHRQLSGMGEAALTWSSALSALTSVGQLDRLTFLPWRKVIAQNGLPLVSKGQFCPICLAEDQACGRTPYFRLAWESKSVTVCHKHNVRLSQHCPCCGKDNVRHAAALVCPGWCTKCGAFLGGQNQAASQPVEPVELWQARQMHELLQTHQKLETEPQRDQLVHAIKHIVAEMDGGHSAHFANRIGLSKSTVHYWLQTDKTPTLEVSMRIAGLSGMSLTSLLTGNTSDWTAPSISQQLPLPLFKPEAKPRSARRSIDWADVEAQLQKFLLLPTPLSVREISRQLGIDVRTLYLNCSQTTRQLGERSQAYLKRRKQAKLESAMPHLESAARQALTDGKSINLREMTARVPTSVLSGVHGLYGVLKDVRHRIEASP